MLWIEYLQSADWTQASWIALGAYCLGCFCTGYYLARARKGLDLRQIGSGSVGARNAGRVLGKTGFAITLAGDMAKGYLAVWLVGFFSVDHRLGAVAMLCVVAGHLWPLQLRGRGGKGVATALGALLAYDWRLFLVLPLLFLAPFAMVRRTVHAGLVAFALLPLVAVGMAREASTTGAFFEAWVIGVLSGMIVLAHRKNISEEISGLFGPGELDPESRHSHL